MIPWYSVTYSNGMEHLFISYKLVVLVLLGPFILSQIIKGIFKLFLWIKRHAN